MKEGQRIYVEEQRARKTAKVSALMNDYQKAVQKFQTAKKDGDKALAKADALSLARKINKVAGKGTVKPKDDGLY